MKTPNIKVRAKPVAPKAAVVARAGMYFGATKMERYVSATESNRGRTLQHVLKEDDEQAWGEHTILVLENV